jgi:hypothetical protein
MTMTERFVSGHIIEAKHKELYIRKCPRPRGTMPTCLLEPWVAIIEELQQLDKDIHKIISGRKGKRTVNLELLNEILLPLEERVRERLLETEDGIVFLEQETHRGLKMVTYCVLGCQKIWLEFSKTSGKLSDMKAKLLNELFIRYYLQDEKHITNAMIQIYEQAILRRIELLREGKLEVINEEKQITSTEEREENELEEYAIFSLDEEVDEEDYLLNWEAFEREEEPQPMVEEVKADLIDFLRDDKNMNDTLLNFCPKNDLTCDVDSEFYSLVVVKLIHSFLKKAQLFADIDLTAQCLQDGSYDVTALRGFVDLYVSQYGKEWDWTAERKDKFLLCSICHIVRHAVSLSKLNLIDGLEVFFSWKGELFKLNSKLLEVEKKSALELLQQGKPQPNNCTRTADASTVDISDEQLERYRQLCQKCMKTVSFADCAKKVAVVEKAIVNGQKVVQELWGKQEDLRPCIANKLLK